MPSNNQSNLMFQRQDLLSLKKNRSESDLLISLFLDLRPQTTLLNRFKQLLDHAPQQFKLDQAPVRYLDQWQKEVDQISRWLEQNQHHHAVGLALFSSQVDQIWQVYLLPVPVVDQLVIKNQPYIRPLEILLAEAPGSDLSKIDQQETGQQELKHVKELTIRTGDKEQAVFGLENILLAVRPVRVKTVRMLIVDQDYHQAGDECPNCGYLGVDDQPVCQICGMALRPDPDVIEIALKRVIDAGGAIDILRSKHARQAFKLHGKIGALLHRHGIPSERDSSNQLPMAKDGEINRDIIHDEAIEESFPASDPPAWNA